MTLLRLRVATQFGQTVDEAHYYLYGKFLDWSYFDHPPLVGWVQALFQQLPLSGLLQARIPAMLLSLLTSKLLFDYLLSKNVSERNSLYAVLALNLTPMFNAMSVALLPDTLLMPLTLLIVDRTEKVLTHSNLKNWLLLGLWLGLAGLSKYTAALYVFALIIIFTSKRRWREVLKPDFWAGLGTALLLVLPVLYWNIRNHFSSFQYQADHVLTLNSGIIKNLSASFAIQLVSWGLGPFIMALLAFVILMKNITRLRSYYSSVITASVFLVFFIYVAVSEVLLPHWMLVFFVLMIPLGYSHFLERKMFLQGLLISTLISGILSFLLLFEMAFKIFPPATTAGLYEGVTGWDEVMKQASETALHIEKKQLGLAVMNWTLGSRAMYYNDSKLPVFVIDKRHDQFDIWTPQSPVGFDLLVIIEAAKKDEHLAHLNCAEITSVGEKTTLIKEVPVNHFLYYHCANFLGYKE